MSQNGDMTMAALSALEKSVIVMGKLDKDLSRLRKSMEEVLVIAQSKEHLSEEYAKIAATARTALET